MNILSCSREELALIQMQHEVDLYIFYIPRANFPEHKTAATHDIAVSQF